MALLIPDIRQSTDFDCGSACFRAVLAYYGRKWPAPKADPMDGLHPFYLEACFRRAGLRVLSGEMDLVDLQYHLRRARPVVCLIRADNVGHWVIVNSLTRTRVYYHDPLAGIQYQKRSQWLSCWTDVDKQGTMYRGHGIAVWEPV